MGSLVTQAMMQIVLTLLIAYLVLIVISHMQIGNITLAVYGLVLPMDLPEYSYLDVLINLAHSKLLPHTLFRILCTHTNLLHCSMDGMVFYPHLSLPPSDYLIHPHVVILDGPSPMLLVQMALSNVNYRICLKLHYLHYTPLIFTLLYLFLHTVSLILGSLLLLLLIVTFALMAIRIL